VKSAVKVMVSTQPPSCGSVSEGGWSGRERVFATPAARTRQRAAPRTWYAMGSASMPGPGGAAGRVSGAGGR